MICNTAVQKTSLSKKQDINAFLAKVILPPVWFWFLSVMGVKGKYMFQALGIIRGSKAQRHPEPEPVYHPRPCHGLVINYFLCKAQACMVEFRFTIYIHLTMDFSTAFWDRHNSHAFHYTCCLNLDPEFLLKMMRFDLKV